MTTVQQSVTFQRAVTVPDRDPPPTPITGDERTTFGRTDGHSGLFP
jgi:hypothetical protein